jgi:hypothetical protein
VKEEVIEPMMQARGNRGKTINISDSDEEETEEPLLQDINRTKE